MGRGRGRGQKQRTMRRDFAKSRDNKWNSNKNSNFMTKDDLYNEAFEEYYKTQNIVPEGEWEDFVACLKKPLPTTFRINGSGKFANELREKLESDFFSYFSQGPITIDGEVVEPPRPLPWYPSNLGWHMDFSRGQLRKLSWLEDIHNFMKRANDAGSITRQEAVSMVPPLFLDVQPHHRVLDMCAAPGSKTFQLLEALHSDVKGLAPSGFVVANDADAQRCNLLTHQTKRMCSPCLMVTNHNAEQFPKIQAFQTGPPTAGAAATPGAATAADGAATATAAAGSNGRKGDDNMLLYDRILADVPCSGDGTIRKAPDIWRRWSVNNGNGLHIMQLKIALQAARLLKVGGRMVYSTCTFNPIEDEAVVGELLLRCGGSLELLDVSDQLPKLKRMPGLTQWKVKDRHQFYDTWEEAEKVGYKLDPTMFSNPQKSALPLDRCMRILPHHGDTGGFFVAVLQKVKPLEGELLDPDLSHRFAKAVTGKGGNVSGTLDGVDPLEGARQAAGYAVEAAEKAIAALESGDATAISQANAAAAAALSKVLLAQDAHKDMQTQAKQQQNSQQHKQQSKRDKRGASDRGDKGLQEGPTARVKSGSKSGVDHAEQTSAVAVADADGDDADGDAMSLDEAPATASVEDMDEAPATASVEDMDEAPATASVEDMDELREDLYDAEGARQQQQDDVSNAPSSSATANATTWTPSWVRGGGGRGRTGGGGRWRGIDPILPVEDPAILNALIDFYGIEPDFPLSTHIITRSLEAALPKRLYFVSDALLGLLLADTEEKLKITSTGLKIFERHEIKGKEQGKCSYRIAQEGLPFLLPHLTKQVIKMGLNDFIRLLTERNLPLLPPSASGQHEDTAGDTANGSTAGTVNGSTAELQQQGGTGAPESGSNQPGGSLQAGGKSTKHADAVPAVKQSPLASPAVLAQLEQAAPGGAVCLLEEHAAEQLGLATQEVSGALTANAPLAISVWRTRASLGVFVTKGECEQILDKIKAAQAKMAATAKADAAKL